MLCKQLVILGRALQTINDPTQKVFITLILPRTGVLCKYSMVPDVGNCQFMSLQIEGCSINIPWFYTEEGTVQTGRDCTHNMVFCKYLVILYVEVSEYIPDFTEMKGSSKYSLIVFWVFRFCLNSAYLGSAFTISKIRRQNSQSAEQLSFTFLLSAWNKLNLAGLALAEIVSERMGAVIHSPSATIGPERAHDPMKRQEKSGGSLY